MNADFLLGLVQFIAVLAALIIIHELGHFLAARLFKVKVEEFGLGFPPRLVSLFEAGGTKFSLNAIPLGGFVRLKGENDPSVPGGIAAASPWVRLAVFFAGPVMNLLVGAILYAVIFMRIGMPDPTRVQIMGVAENSPSEQAGLRPGDLILQVNGQAIESTDDLRDAVLAALEKPTRIAYQRDDQVYETTLVPRSNPPAGEGAIGIEMGNPTRPVNLVEAIPTGGVAVYNHARLLLQLPVYMLQGRISPEEGRLVGFKGMFDIYQEVRQNDVGTGMPAGINILGFFTTITISLGVLNLLPIPALDGGRILFTLPEIVLRRRIPPHYEGMINLISFAMLLLLLLYINLQDFINPATLPR